MSFEQNFHQLGRAIDAVLIAQHGLSASLKPGHVPFTADLPEAVARYGATPLLHLWSMCKALEELRVRWTGLASPPRLAEPTPESVTESAPSPESGADGTESGTLAGVEAAAAEAKPAPA